jgi:diaminopimelate decarboxylase
VHGAAQLQEILHGAQGTLEETAAKLKHPVVIDIEPGRAALEQAGLTVLRVRAVRNIGSRQVVVVDGNSRDLADSFGNEFLVDPVLVTTRHAAAEPFAAAIASNTCKEDDFLARRYIPLPFRPAPGDLLVYVNTAGYEMDSKESSFHRLPLPVKVAAMKRAGGWRFITDNEFSITDCLPEELD